MPDCARAWVLGATASSTARAGVITVVARSVMWTPFMRSHLAVWRAATRSDEASSAPRQQPWMERRGVKAVSWARPTFPAYEKNKAGTAGPRGDVRVGVLSHDGAIVAPPECRRSLPRFGTCRPA